MAMDNVFDPLNLGENFPQRVFHDWRDLFVVSMEASKVPQSAKSGKGVAGILSSLFSTSPL